MTQQTMTQQVAIVRPPMAIVLLVAALVVLSSLWLSWSIYHARTLTSELQVLKSERNRLHVQWGQLQLESSTWGTYMRVEKTARNDLNMIVPKAGQRVVVTP